MDIDIGCALAETASPGISRESLDELDQRVTSIHETIQDQRAKGEHGYAALNLPSTVDLEEISSATDQFDDAKAVVVAGIGGSALGAATLAEALDTEVPLYTLDNVDPATTNDLLDSLPLEDTALVGVSRSGTTAETLANFLVVRDAIDESGGDWTEQTLVITGDSGPLAEMAEDRELPELSVPEGVPGRYSVLSAVGLAPAAIAGVDIERVVEGGASAEKTLTDSLYECPAYAYGAAAYALDIRGATVNAVMPYSEQLECFAEWFAQLWAESLGKDGLGQVPARSLGVTDQHSQLQLYRAGPREVLVTFIDVESRPTCEIPPSEHDRLSYLEDTTLNELMTAEQTATKGSLAAAGRPTVELSMSELTPESLGNLLYTMEAACILAGELYEIDAFTQPAVEWGKRATRALLRGETTKETMTISDQPELRISSAEQASE